MYYNYLIIDEKLKFEYKNIQSKYDKIISDNNKLKKGKILYK